jgi:isoquinoline 1-oxidoreductase beta subunit
MPLTRRAFLRDGAQAGAGLVLSFHLRGAGSLLILPTATAEGAQVSRAVVEFAPNAYIRMGSDNIVRLWATRSEMGQGVRTLLPMVLADELGADWEKIVIEQAGQEPRFKGIRLRTSGSGSAAGTWKPLRIAAATAREMLISAAAKRWKVDPQSCRAERGQIVHVPSGRKFSFGELAAAAAQLPPPAKPKLKDVRDLHLIGKPVKRADAKAIVSGSAIYGLDVRRPGMLYAVIARCPYLGGKLASFDPAPALSVSGVKQAVPVRSGFAGGVAVVATNTWAAMKGRDALQAVWDKGPNAKFDSDVLTREMEAALDQTSFAIRRDGDAPAALAAAQKTMAALYEYPFQAHAPLETMNCTAEVSAGSCEIWVPTQAPEAAQKDAAKLLEIPEDAVKVNVTMLGGGFGRRLQTDYIPEAVEIARAIGKPVQVVWTRDDDMKHGFFHPPKLERLRAALNDHGLPIAWHHQSAGPHLSLLGPSEEEKKNPRYFSDDGMLWGSFDNPYNIAHQWADFTLVESPVPTGPWRAVMYPSTVFARESFLDEIAHAGMIDPIELRLRLLEPGDILDLKATRIDRARLIAVLKLVAVKSGWPLGSHTEASSAAAQCQEASRLRGRGVACNVYDGSCYVAQIAEVSVSRDLVDIKVHRIISAIDCGLVLNPLGIEGQTESAVAWAMTAALGGAIHFKNGQAQERSYADFKVVRMDQAPQVDTYLLQGSDAPGGFGETAVPPVAPAIANAIFNATGRRLRRLPITIERLQAG